MITCSLVRTALASDSARPSSASVPSTTGRPIVTSSVVLTSPCSVLASSRTVHCIRPALVVRPQPGRSARDRQAACPRFLTLPPETFDFLGFTFICSISRRGTFLLKRKTRRDRLRAKLGEIKEELRQRRHQPIPEQG